MVTAAFQMFHYRPRGPQLAASCRVLQVLVVQLNKLKAAATESAKIMARRANCLRRCQPGSSS